MEWLFGWQGDHDTDIEYNSITRDIVKLKSCIKILERTLEKPGNHDPEYERAALRVLPPACGQHNGRKQPLRNVRLRRRGYCAADQAGR